MSKQTENLKLSALWFGCLNIPVSAINPVIPVDSFKFHVHLLIGSIFHQFSGSFVVTGLVVMEQC